MIKLTSIRSIKSVVISSMIVLGLAVGLMADAKADDLSVRATLSEDTTEVGQPVDLTLEIKGARNAQVPTEIDVSGLRITHTGQQTQVQVTNFNISSATVIHTYTILAEHAGKFTIPALTVNVGTQKFTTAPLTLTVAENGNGNSTANATASAPEPKTENDNNFAFAEFVVPKKNVYVGEAIPVELRIYFDERVRIEQAGMPDIKSEGFSIQKLNQPEQGEVEKNGKHYILLTFKTAVTPVKSGELSLGPAEMPFVGQVPIQRAPRQRHAGGLDDFFNDNLFNDMMGLSPPQRGSVNSSAVDFEVKPLPKANQPKSFSGAVGLFTLTTDASPLKLNVGDPITIKLKISGRGNFDRVTAPVLMDDEGWHNYPPSAKFVADDDLGISGSKSFEIAAIPNEKKTTLPGTEFSYFDPVSEKYVILKGDRLPITVEGNVPATAIAQAIPPGQPSPAPEAAKSANDIHYISTETPQWNASFSPVFRQRNFWNAQAAPALALLVFAGLQVRRRKKQDVLAQQLAAWRRKQHELMKILRHADTEQAAFYDAAIHYIQIAAARASHQNPESIGAAEATASRPLDAATREGVQSIFTAHGELRYAGAAVTRQKLPDPRRREVLETLRRFEDANV